MIKILYTIVTWGSYGLFLSLNNMPWYSWQYWVALGFAFLFSIEHHWTDR